MNEDALRRLEEVNKKRNRNILPHILIIIGFFVILMVASELWSVKVRLVLIAAAVIYFIYFFKVVLKKDLAESEEFIRQSRDILVPEILFPELSKTFDNLSWDSSGGISEEEFSMIGIFKVYNEYHTRGLITGSYKGMNIRMSQVSSIWHKTQSNQKQGRYSMFSGWVYTVDLPFTVGAVKVISDKGVTSPLMQDRHYDIGAFGMQITPLNRELDDHFDVFTFSYDDANRVLQPAVMEALDYAHEKLWYYHKDKARFRLAFGFIGNQMYMMVQDAYSGFQWYESKINVEFKMHYLQRDIDVLKNVFDGIATLGAPRGGNAETTTSGSGYNSSGEMEGLSLDGVMIEDM